MGKIGFGYGSEYQLMRFMGRHLHEFNRKVNEVLTSDDEIIWFDFNRQNHLDRELMNMDFITDEKIKKAWSDVWPTNGGKSGINWDAVGLTKDTYLLVEAKAHHKEVFQGMGATHKDSISMIRKAFADLAKAYNLTINDSWEKDHYQMMNRLVAVDFLHRMGLKAFLVNVYFIHGYEINARGISIKKNLSINSKESWQHIIDEQYHQLGLTNSSIKKFIKHVFIEC